MTRAVTSFRPALCQVVWAAVVLPAGLARGGDTEDARAHLQKATAAFALTH